MFVLMVYTPLKYYTIIFLLVKTEGREKNIIVSSKHYDLNTDITLGGEYSSDIYIASQKAVKTYIDNILGDIASVLKIINGEKE